MSDNIIERHARIWDFIITETGVRIDGIHGPRHWARVERNGLFLARESGANPDVVSMFALFHDSRRVNDHIDPEHGARGAAFAKTFRSTLDFLDDAAFDQLVYACTWHTDELHHDDPTIHTCFDADRLDLGRVGMDPHPKYLNTALGKIYAAEYRIDELDSEDCRGFG